MKSCIILAWVTFLFAAGLVAAEPPTKVRISADSFKESEWADGDNKFESWAYKLTLQNTSGQDLADLEIRYRVYLHDQVNADGSPDSPVSFNEYKISLQKLKPLTAKSAKPLAPPAPTPVPAPPLKRSETRTGSTPPMDIGVGSGKTVRVDRDILQGIWVRVFTKNGEELGALVKPASLAKSMPWQ